MCPYDKLAQLVVNDDGFLFDTATGDSFVANPTALVVVRGLQAGQTETDVVANLTAGYEVSTTDAQRAVSDFLARLKLLQLA